MLSFISSSHVSRPVRQARPADLIRRLPGIYTAFFSVLKPRQKLAPHFGCYKGFPRYHMGVLVPNNNEDGKCWIRINADASDTARRDRSLIEKGERYCWKNGEGVVFDDSYLHEAANDPPGARRPRVRFPAKIAGVPLDAFNRFCLFVVHNEPSVKRIRRNAIVGG